MRRSWRALARHDWQLVHSIERKVMRYISIAIILLATLGSGCLSTTFRQPSAQSPTFSAPTANALVLMELGILWKGDSSPSHMYGMFTRADPGRRPPPFRQYGITDFMTYPVKFPHPAAGAPSYVQAFALEPGDYYLDRCWSKSEPARSRCIPGDWKHHGESVGRAWFRVNAGEVINIGQLVISYEDHSIFSPTTNVSLRANEMAAKTFLSNVAPGLVPMLKDRAISFA